MTNLTTYEPFKSFVFATIFNPEALHSKRQFEILDYEEVFRNGVRKAFEQNERTKYNHSGANLFNDKAPDIHWGIVNAASQKEAEQRVLEYIQESRSGNKAFDIRSIFNSVDKGFREGKKIIRLETERQFNTPIEIAI